MTRTLDTDTLNAAQASVVSPLILVKLALDSGDVLVHSGRGDVVWNGDTYLGVGDLGGIDGGSEDSELGRNPMKLTLSGVDSGLAAVVLGEHYQGRTGTVYYGYIDTTTNVLAGDPFILHRGRIDAAKMSGGKTRTIELTIENRFASWDKPKVRRYNNADQQSRYPGDKGMEFVEQATDKQLLWGAQA